MQLACALHKRRLAGNLIVQQSVKSARWLSGKQELVNAHISQLNVFKESPGGNLNCSEMTLQVLFRETSIFFIPPLICCIIYVLSAVAGGEQEVSVDRPEVGEKITVSSCCWQSRD